MRTRLRLAQIRLGIKGQQTPCAQPPAPALGIHWIALLHKPGRAAPHPGERAARVLLIQQAHQLQILRTFLDRLVVQPGAVQPQQLALPPQTDLAVVRLDQLALLRKRLIQLFFAPVDFDFELADRLVELRAPGLFILSGPRPFA